MEKLAAIHCRTTPWWALDVFEDLIEEEINFWAFSEIQIFTIYSEIKTVTIKNNKIQIITALPKRLNRFFQRNSRNKLPIIKHFFDYRNLIFFYPTLMKILSKKIKKYNPNKLIISSFAIAKNIEQCKNQKAPSKKTNSTIYFHSPMQYIRSHSKEYDKKLKWRKWKIFKIIKPKLKKRDLNYTNYNKVYSNSKYTQELVKNTYNIESEVKYPKLNQNFFNEKIIEKPKDYIVCVWRIVKFVREIDVIINAFNEIDYQLIIIWSWPDEQELKKIANKNIIFTWRKTPKESIEIIKYAKWMINLTKESFGLSTAESLCLWVPVLGYDQWATPELVDKKSGILIANKTEKNIVDNFHKFIKTNRNRLEISNNARKTFSSK